jgi:hypothetical protein
VTRKVVITAGEVSVTASLNDSPTADRVWAALPIKASASTWGDEIYFSTPITGEAADDATDVFERGALAYWPPGRALCIFFGPTPASTGDEPRMASPGNLVGMIEGPLGGLRKVRSGSPISIDRA